MVFYRKYAVANSTRSRALSASEKKPPRNVRVVEGQEDSKVLWDRKEAD